MRGSVTWPCSAICLVLVALACAGATIASADRQSIACGARLTKDTRLATDLVDCPGPGLVIDADGIRLDLNGHTVDGDGAGDDVGIEIAGHRDVTVTHGTVRGFAEGVLVSRSRGIVVRRLTSGDQGHGGITVDRSTAVT